MKIIKLDTTNVAIVMTVKEAQHIGTRLDVSSYESFDTYRKANKLGNFHRHPLAEAFQAAVAEVA
jgi:hypothetical protein